MSTSVYIPTRARVEMAMKAIDQWMKVGLGRGDINLVIDPKDRDRRDYERLSEFEGVHLLYLGRTNAGLGYIRDFILDFSLDDGERVHIQADDDYYPTDGDANKFAEVVLKNEVVGCGASYSYHGLSLGNDVIKLKDVDFPLLSPGMGGNVFAINNHLAEDVGGFPHWATCLGEDHEMVRQGIEAGMPWYYSTRLRISGHKRYTAGGHEDLYGSVKARSEEEQVVHQKIHDRWPKYVSKPPARYRSAWKKMMAHYVDDRLLRQPLRVRRVLEARS